MDDDDLRGIDEAGATEWKDILIMFWLSIRDTQLRITKKIGFLCLWHDRAANDTMNLNQTSDNSSDSQTCPSDDNATHQHYKSMNSNWLFRFVFRTEVNPKRVHLIFHSILLHEIKRFQPIKNEIDLHNKIWNQKRSKIDVVLVWLIQN